MAKAEYTVVKNRYDRGIRKVDEVLDSRGNRKALKQTPFDASNAEVVQRVSMIDNPNLLVPEDVFEEDGYLFEIYPFVEKPTLSGAKLTDESAVAGIALDVAYAVRSLHRNRMVHGDIYAKNVFSDGEHSMLFDFSRSEMISPFSSSTPQDDINGICHLIGEISFMPSSHGSALSDVASRPSYDPYFNVDDLIKDLERLA